MLYIQLYVLTCFPSNQALYATIAPSPIDLRYTKINFGYVKKSG